MTKQEKIKEAYGVHWMIVSKYVDENGWLASSNDREFPEPRFSPSIGDLEEHESEYLFRPISLKGIEYNNGWIKIESEDDLPKEGMTNYLTSFNDKVSHYTCNLFEVLKLYKDGYITHYQPIVNPQPPIY